MLCIEILFGDEVVCRAGHKDMTLVTATLHLMAQPPFQRLIVSGAIDPSPEFSQRPRWLDLSLLRGKELSLRIVEVDTVDEPAQVANFGTWPGEDDKKYFCSFCGAAGESGARLMIGVNANICAGCVRSFGQWASLDQPN